MNTKTTKIKTGIMHRTATLKRSVDGRKRLITASVSIDTQYLRQWGLEILSRGPGHVNLEGVKRGACHLLTDPTQKQPIGKVMKVKLDGSRAVIQIKVGRSTLAEQFLCDVKNGIRTEISIWYAIHEMEHLIGPESEAFLVTSWELLHTSLVAESANSTGGTCRFHEQRDYLTVVREVNITKVDEGKTVNAPSLAMASKAGKKALYEEAKIKALGKIHNMRVLAEEAIMKGQSLDNFREAVLSEIEKRGVPPIDISDSAQGIVGNSQKQQPSSVKPVHGDGNKDQILLTTAFSLGSASTEELHTAVRILALMYIASEATGNEDKQYSQAMSLVSKVLEAALHAPHWPVFNFNQTPGNSKLIN